MNTAVVRSKASLLNQPKGIALSIIIITIIWAIMQWTISAVVFLAIVILFVKGIKKPIWALVALLVSQLTVTSYMITTPFVNLSLRLVLLLLTLWILRGAISRKEVNFGPDARKLIIPVIILISISVVANLANSIDFDSIFRDFRNMVVGLLFIILLPAIIENTKQLKMICSVAFIVVTASAVIGVSQHFNILGMGNATLIPGFISKLGRVPGMSETELELSYILPVTLIIITGIYLTRGINYSNKKYLIIPVLAMLAAVYYTYTRSALLSLGCGLLSIGLFWKMRGKWWIIMVILLIILVFLANSDIIAGASMGGRSESGQEESSIARAVLFQAGVAIALDNPVFGIGYGQFLEISPQYTSRVDPNLIQWEVNRYWSYRTLGTTEPHNDYVMTWLSYGTLALVLFLWLHFVILRNFMHSFFTSKDRFVKGLSLGLAGALITYVTNAFYHNMLATMSLFWILAGFSLVTMKLAAKEKIPSPVQVGSQDSRIINNIKRD